MFYQKIYYDLKTQKNNYKCPKKNFILKYGLKFLIFNIRTLILKAQQLKMAAIGMVTCIS